MMDFKKNNETVNARILPNGNVEFQKFGHWLPSLCPDARAQGYHRSCSICCAKLEQVFEKIQLNCSAHEYKIPIIDNQFDPHFLNEQCKCSHQEKQEEAA